MYTHPHIGSQIGSERQRDRLARAQQQRLARQVRHLSSARRAERREPALLRVTRLRSILSATTPRGRHAMAARHIQAAARAIWQITARHRQPDRATRSVTP